MNKLVSAVVLHVLLSISLFSVTEAANKYPIVLVHGFSGWGRKEVLGVPYWGKFQGDFQEKLKKEGHQVFTVGIGKFSSNWDRACELYAEIKGGKVDYGLNHSQTHGHARYGRTYPGLFPEWGTVVNGTLQKIHLMGHSLGGTTIRMLTQLLNKGAGNATVPEDPNSHPLFTGGKDWVHSITTIGSPNRGTTIADMVINHRDLLELFGELVSGLSGVVGELMADFYDLQLDQWGLEPRQEGESLEAFFKRVRSNKLFGKGFKDNAGYSMTVAGAAAENAWVKTLPNVYYYSYVADATVLTRDASKAVVATPDEKIDNPLEMPIAEIIGSRLTSELGFSDEWLPNDGLVNVISQISDGIGKVFDFDGVARRGAWVSFNTLRIDHSSLMGMNTKIPVYDVYKAHAALLSNLPAHDEVATASSKGSASAGGPSTKASVGGEHKCPQAIVKAVQAAQDAIVASFLKPADK